MNFKKLKSQILIVVIAALLMACSGSQTYAPVDDAWYQAGRHVAYHKVRTAETLYAIAWRYDLDFRDLASYNHLAPPYVLYVGQRLRLNNKKGHLSPYVDDHLTSKKKKSYASSTHKKMKFKGGRMSAPKVVQTEEVQATSSPIGHWLWPVRGPILNRFSLQEGRKGIDIGGSKGMPIKAAAGGYVAYAGQGLRGYGNLLIIKHNNVFLSAYAHNDKLLVKEGEKIKAGQIIAEMGNSDANNVALHFEIRKAGKPVNPLSYLP